MEIVNQSRQLICPRGRWLIMKGIYPQSELQGMDKRFLNVHRLQVARVASGTAFN